MKAAGALAAGVLLLSASVTLIGCGAGDETPSPKPSPLKLVSQTYHCNEIKTGNDKPGTVASYSLKIDAEGLKWRSDFQEVRKIESPSLNQTFELRTSSVFDMSKGRHTISNFTDFKGGISPVAEHACIYFEVPQLQEADVRACLDSEFASMLVSEECPAERKCYLAKEEATTAKFDTFVLHVDGDMVWKNIVHSKTVASSTTTTEMPDPDSKGGAPPSKVFEIPEDWGTCKKATVEQVMAVELNSLVPPFLTECSGLKLPANQNSQAQLMNAKLQQLATQRTDHGDRKSVV